MSDTTPSPAVAPRDMARPEATQPIAPDAPRDIAAPRDIPPSPLLEFFPSVDELKQMNVYLDECEKVIDTLRFEPNKAQLSMQWVLSKAMLGQMVAFAYATAFVPTPSPTDERPSPTPGDERRGAPGDSRAARHDENLADRERWDLQQRQHNEFLQSNAARDAEIAEKERQERGHAEQLPADQTPDVDQDKPGPLPEPMDRPQGEQLPADQPRGSGDKILDLLDEDEREEKEEKKHKSHK